MQRTLRSGLVRKCSFHCSHEMGGMRPDLEFTFPISLRQALVQIPGAITAQNRKKPKERCRVQPRCLSCNGKCYQTLSEKLVIVEKQIFLCGNVQYAVV